jgi:hypothetical protein
VGQPLRSPGSQSIFTREACTQSQRGPEVRGYKTSGG